MRRIDILPKKAYRWPNKHMKRCSALLIIRELHIETMRYHLTPVRMTSIKKITSVGETVEQRESQHTVHCDLIQQLWKTVWRFL